MVIIRRQGFHYVTNCEPLEINLTNYIRTDYFPNSVVTCMVDLREDKFRTNFNNVIKTDLGFSIFVYEFLQKYAFSMDRVEYS